MIVGEKQLNTATPLASMPLLVPRNDPARGCAKRRVVPASPRPPYSVRQISIIVRGEPA
jgi:hypothetical protein